MNKKEIINNPSIRFVPFITDFINNNIRFHTIQLFIKSSPTKFITEGTGVLLNFHGVCCLLTSGNVVEDTFENNFLYFKLGPEEYLFCTGTTEASELKRKSLDLAYIILDIPIAESLIDVGYKFLPNNKTLPHHDGLETKQYAVIGFPKTINDLQSETSQPNGSYIIAPMAPDNYYDNHIYTKEDNFIISYTQPQEIMTGNKTISKELNDMS
ncbi:MAG TPA: hypothetical protein PKD51_19290 [Saprospiraceae bacterium]|nr:hypothetical protein [Saprospiraceae bacterium]HMU04510.1 hypothetical protein [Saprospiraceae bacterium]